MAAAATRVIDETPIEDLAGETVAALVELGESVDAALRAASLLARDVEIVDRLVVLLHGASWRPEGA